MDGGADDTAIPEGISPVTNAVCRTGRSTSAHGFADCAWHGSQDHRKRDGPCVRLRAGRRPTSWVLGIDVSGRPYDFDGQNFFGPFSETRAQKQRRFVQHLAHTRRGFDVFRDGDDIMVSACGDKEAKLHVWNISKKTYKSYDVNIRSGSDYDDSARAV